MVGTSIVSELRSNISLSDHTTLHLGGPCTLFAEIRSVEELRSVIDHARQNNLRTLIIGGGSNIIVPDEGFNGLVIKIAMRGIRLEVNGRLVDVSAEAGEPWDPFVRHCVTNGLSGIECLSGIPGLVGATPIQNVGAYGQEVSETITSVRALDTQSLEVREFAGSECEFGYRQSRFKHQDRDLYIITGVTFTLEQNGPPTVRYAELEHYLASKGSTASSALQHQPLHAVREAVLALRRTKAMVIDPSDPNTRSVGSFFLNPVITTDQFAALRDRWSAAGGTDPIPRFVSAAGIKVPAAWLVERAGFTKGYRKGGAGISEKHSLALVNHSGTTRELLALADEIVEGVLSRFGIRLVQEPVLVR
jgi:UDP-N-acetylmuramate dehydrogenase